MSVQFNAALSQYLSIAAPRPELNGLTSWMLVVRTMFPTTGAGAGLHRYTVAFSTGASASVVRAGAGHYQSGATHYVWSEARTSDPDFAVVHIQNSSLVNVINVVAHYMATSGGSRTAGATQINITNAGASSGSANDGSFPVPITSASSLAAAIGANPNGTGNFFDGYIEDVRLYVPGPALFESPIVKMRRIAHSHGSDFPERDPTLIMRWRLIGVGLVVTEKDRVGGIVATAVGGPSYDRRFGRTRRRNRGG